MIATRERSSIRELEKRHCPAAVVHAKIGTPRDVDPALMVGKVAHSIFENLALNREALAVDVVDRTVVAACVEGLAFEGGKPEIPRIEEALEARRLVLQTLDRFDLPSAEYVRPELEVNMSPLGWGLVEGEKCLRCEGKGGFCESPAGDSGYDDQFCDCGRCHGSGEIWPVHWHQLIDLAAQGAEEDAYGDAVTVATGLDYKGWNAGEHWFDSLQGAGCARSLATLFPEAQILRRGCVPYQMGRPFWDEIDLRTEEGRDRLDDYGRMLELDIERGQAISRRIAGMERATAIETYVMPGPGCYAGFGGCPYFAMCDPAIARASRLAFKPMLAFDSIESSAEAFALGSALRQEAARQLKGYGGGPIKTPTGHLVGWRDTSRPDGNVSDNAPMLIAREYAPHILSRPEDAAKIEGMIRAAGVGHNGAGVTVVRKLVKKLEDAGMERAELDRLLELCLEPKPGRKLDVWRGELPKPEEDELEKQLRESIEQAKT